ncbi:nuclear transport factor 2 family protein [Streptomyces pactum]|uniref:nuclear transport factor 2 family protein n=1 Tax=Streptomyces pactum TaxID=68249 RepID=UPI000AB28A2B|nr:nuclear transport factor 2 family protein [Streptomyces pactum]
MSESPTSIVAAAFRYYRAQDRDAVTALYADDFSFTSPQDDHIGEAAFFERCLSTAGRPREQRLPHVTPADGELVLAGPTDADMRRRF